MADKTRKCGTKYILMLASALFFACQSAEELKREQYFVEGYQLYTAHCSNCHQDNGKGLANLYPGLENAEIFKNPAVMACLIRNGSVATNKARPMPANAKLTELEIAEVMTYVKVKWGNDSVYTSTELVTKALADCSVK